MSPKRRKEPAARRRGEEPGGAASSRRRANGRAAISSRALPGGWHRPAALRPAPFLLPASSSTWIATAFACATWSGKPTTAASSRVLSRKPSATANTCAFRPLRTPTRATWKPCTDSKKTSFWPGKLLEPRRLPRQSAYLPAVLQSCSPQLAQGKLAPLANHRAARPPLATRTWLASTPVPGLLPERVWGIRCAQASLAAGQNEPARTIRQAPGRCPR
jgi:hypothetical protein